MNIQEGVTCKTSCDKTITILSVSHPFAFGEGEDFVGVWDSRTGRTLWGIEGHITKVFDWRDEIPWEALKDKIQYVAMDCNRIWYGYEVAPLMAMDDITGWWDDNNPNKHTYFLEGVKMPTPPDWKESLVTRPAGEA